MVVLSPMLALGAITEDSVKVILYVYLQIDVMPVISGTGMVTREGSALDSRKCCVYDVIASEIPD